MTAQSSEMHIVNIRMLALLDVLKANGVIRFTQEFMDAIGTRKQVMWQIQNRGRLFTVENIRRACINYGVNANYLLGLSDDIFIKPQTKAQTKQGKQRIKTRVGE